MGVVQYNVNRIIGVSSFQVILSVSFLRVEPYLLHSGRGGERGYPMFWERGGGWVGREGRG